MTAQIFIQNGSTIYEPAVEEGIKLAWARKGTPGKLTFSVVKDGILNFQEGNAVSLVVNGINVFYGFVFTKSRDKGGLIAVTAYDQLRYLKNKDTICYANKKASELLSLLALDFNLNLGAVEDTGYLIESAVEENQTLFDIIQNALDKTLKQTRTLYVLYDNFGKLTLTNVANMRLNLLIDDETGENFDYSSSIDTQTYNKIKLTYDNEATGQRDVYLAQDSSKQNLWGVLQYYDQLQDPKTGPVQVNALLGLYNRKTRKLTLKNALGDVRVRAGSSLAVALNLGDIVTNNFMVVEQVTHVFKNDQHLMDLSLIGGDFIA